MIPLYIDVLCIIIAIVGPILVIIYGIKCSRAETKYMDDRIESCCLRINTLLKKYNGNLV